MFVDEVTVTFKAGKGGDGLVSWRREANIPKGGPWGGDGGKGGDVILRADDNVNTLSDFRYKKVIESEKGVPGGTNQMNGRNGEDLIVSVPTGTLIKDEKGEIIHDLSTKGEQILLCRGGRGGFGNAHFPSSTRQTPSFAELGDRGEQIKVTLELKLVADIGIIGLPSAGKSTLISVITSAKPKIADYPFTTLIPNLGILEHKGHSLVLEDVPGLIPGAHKGEGLGIQFLKHIQRTKVLLHLLDLGEYDKCLDNYESIREELKLFDPELAEKKEVIILSKSDILGDEEMIAEVRGEIQGKFPNKKILTISAATNEGVEELKDFLIQNFGQEESEEAPEPVGKIIDLRGSRDPNAWEVESLGDFRYQVTGERIQQIVRMTDMTNIEGIMRIYDVMKKVKILPEIAKRAMEEFREKFPDSEIDDYTIFAHAPDGKIVIEKQEFPMDKVLFMK